MLPFDFSINVVGFPRLRVIELDGLQHFENVYFDGKTSELDRIRKHDKIKTHFCMDNEKHLIRIPYSNIENMEKYLIKFLGVTEKADTNNENVILMLCGNEYFN